MVYGILYTFSSVTVCHPVKSDGLPRGSSKILTFSQHQTHKKSEALYFGF